MSIIFLFLFYILAKTYIMRLFYFDKHTGCLNLNLNSVKVLIAHVLPPIVSFHLIFTSIGSGFEGPSFILPVG